MLTASQPAPQFRYQHCTSISRSAFLEEGSLRARHKSPVDASLRGGFELLLAQRAPANPTKCVARAFARTNVQPLRISVADCTEKLDAARELVKQRYAWRGYDIGDLGRKRRSTVANIARNEVTFVAAIGQVTVGTLTLRLDGPKGLLAEVTHDGVVDSVRRAGGKVCELTRLAIAEHSESRMVLAALLAAAHALGCGEHGLTDVFIEVNPRHVAFYCRILGFSVVAGEKTCERVGAPSVLLRLELKALKQRFMRAGVSETDRQELALAQAA